MNKQDNEKIWDKLVNSDVPCSRPNLNLTLQQAKENLDKYNFYGDIKNKKVLCLASGGGQQSIEFALLGADVTVVDFSNEQLKKDKIAAKNYSLSIKAIKTDMRNLLMFQDKEFDIIHQPYSINYIPEINKLLDEIARVIKPAGVYHLMFHNPFTHGSWKTGCWGGKFDVSELWKGIGYPLWQPYKDGYEIETVDPNWDFTTSSGEKIKIESPQEYKHTLSTILNGLISRGFNILKFDEYKTNRKNSSKPGTWEHYVSIAVPWLLLWAKKV